MIFGYLVFVYTMCSTPMYDATPKKILFKTFEDAFHDAKQVAAEQAYILNAEVEALKLFNPQYYTDRWGSVDVFHITRGSDSICSIKVMAVYSEDEEHYGASAAPPVAAPAATGPCSTNIAGSAGGVRSIAFNKSSGS